MKKLFVGCLAIALLISNMTVVSAQTATDTTQEKTSTFDGIEIVTGETYQPVSEGKNTMKNVAMGDTMEICIVLPVLQTLIGKKGNSMMAMALYCMAEMQRKS